MTIDTDPIDLSAVVELIESAREGFDAGDQEPWLARIDGEYARIDDAFGRACREDTDAALVLAAGLEEYWSLRSQLSVGCEWLTRALALEGGTPKHRADALHALGELEFARGEYEASISAYEHALERYTEFDDTEHVVDTLCLSFATSRSRRTWNWAHLRTRSLPSNGDNWSACMSFFRCSRNGRMRQQARSVAANSGCLRSA